MNGGPEGDRYRGLCLIVSRPRGGRGHHRAISRRTAAGPNYPPGHHLYPPHHPHHPHHQGGSGRPFLPSPAWPPRHFSHPHPHHHPHQYRSPSYGGGPPPPMSLSPSHPHAMESAGPGGYGGDSRPVGGGGNPMPWASSYDGWTPYQRVPGRRSLRHTNGFSKHSQHQDKIVGGPRYYGGGNPASSYYQREEEEEEGDDLNDQHYYGGYYDEEDVRYRQYNGDHQKDDGVDQMAQLSIEAAEEHSQTPHLEDHHAPVRRIASRSGPNLPLNSSSSSRLHSDNSKSRSSGGSPSRACDTVSVTSDEGAPDTILPRIIKPRKRRKKDRKPSNSSTASEDSKKDSGVGSNSSSSCSVVKESQQADGRTFVTLKPYVPLFYSYDCGSDSEKSKDQQYTELESIENETLGKNKYTNPEDVCASSITHSIDAGGELVSKNYIEEEDPNHSAPHDRVCGCEKCVPTHSFPTPPSSPSSSSSFSSKKLSSSSHNKSSSSSLSCGGDQSSSPGLSSSGSDDEFWPISSTNASNGCKYSNSTALGDRQLVRSFSEPTQAYKCCPQTGRSSGVVALTPHSCEERKPGDSIVGEGHQKVSLVDKVFTQSRRGPNAYRGGSAGYTSNAVPTTSSPSTVMAMCGNNTYSRSAGGAAAPGVSVNINVKPHVTFSVNTLRRRHSLNSQKMQIDYSILHQYAERTPSPDDREWVTVSPLSVTKPVCHFSVMCYNVLCSKYATRQMYGYCPPWALEWEYRKKGIITEIRKYDTDIITLQEVETDAFFNFFLPELKKAGYDGIFSPKSRAKHMQEKEKKFVDGCAIFYRTSKFTLVKEHLIEFTQLAMANHDGSEDMLNRVMPKDNIGLAALLQTKPGAWSEFAPSPDKSTERQTLLVCTAHIHWDPEYCDVKLIQTIMLMTEVRKIVQSVSQAEESSGSRRGQHHRGQEHQSGVHLLLCGDLNSLPESGVVEFLTHGQVSMDHQDFKGHGYKNSLHKLAVINKNHSHSSNSNLYTHSFRLRPAYDTTIMPYTNYTYEFKGIIDYIFHSSETMATIAALGPINPDWFKNNKVVGCPHPHVPSDHFPLVVQLEMCPYGSSIAQPPPPQQQQGHLGHGMGGPHGGGHHLQQHQGHHSHYGAGGGAGGMHPGMGGGPKNNGSMHR